MANIQNEINQINSAIYGKDVRSALSKGLTVVNDQIDDVASQSSTNSGQVSAVGQSVTNMQLEISNVKSTANTNSQSIESLTIEIANQSKASSLGGLNANSSPNLTNSWSMAAGNYFTFMNSSNKPLLGLNVSGNTFAAHHSMCNNASIMEYTPNSDTDNSAPFIFNIPIETTINNKTLTLNDGSLYYNGARILYLDSNLNLCINSPDSTTGSNSQALGITNICGPLSTSGNISVSNGSPTSESGFQISSNNVLTAVNSELNINSSNAYKNINITGDLTVNNQNIMAISTSSLSTSTFSNMNYANKTGIYLTNTTSTLNGMQNIPILQAGCLEVINSNCDNYMSAQTGIIYQRYTTYNNIVYTRVYYANEQHWSSWIRLTPPDEAAGFAVKLNSLGTGISNLALDNNTLKSQNKVLGEQVATLTIENQNLKAQIQSVAATMVQFQLNK